MNPLNLRARRRIASMKEIQALALGLFQRDGFEAVRIEQLAAAAGTSASTIYRYFGTKEGVVLWDDLEAPVGAGVTRRLLLGDSPRRAIREAFCVDLADAIAREGEAHLERIRFIYDTPGVHGEALRQQLEETDSLASELVGLLEEDDDGFTAQVLSAACFSVMDSAIKRWVQEDGAVSLNDLMACAFDAVGWGD
jgi:AcrR family transcriptional regulator